MKTTTKQHTPISLKQTETKAEVIKLGLDIHKKEYVVVRQTGGQAPKSPQKFTPDAFLQWVAKLREQSNRIVSCYEAGCFGYVLHRKLHPDSTNPLQKITDLIENRKFLEERIL